MQNHDQTVLQSWIIMVDTGIDRHIDGGADTDGDWEGLVDVAILIFAKQPTIRIENMNQE